MPSNFNDGDLIEVTHLKQYSGEAYYGGSSTGMASAYLVNLTPPPLSGYPAGSVVNFKPHIDNAASPTLNVNGLGAKSILKNGVTPLAAADIKNGQVVSVVYDGTNFHLLAVASSGGSSVAALTDLTDVTIAAPATGQVLRKSAGGFQAIESPPVVEAPSPAPPANPLDKVAALSRLAKVQGKSASAQVDEIRAILIQMFENMPG